MRYLLVQVLAAQALCELTHLKAPHTDMELSLVVTPPSCVKPSYQACWLSASLSMDRCYLEARIRSPDTPTPAVLPHRTGINHRRWRNNSFNWGRARPLYGFNAILLLILASNTGCSRPGRATVLFKRTFSLRSSSLGRAARLRLALPTISSNAAGTLHRSSAPWPWPSYTPSQAELVLLLCVSESFF